MLGELDLLRLPNPTVEGGLRVGPTTPLQAPYGPTQGVRGGVASTPRAFGRPPLRPTLPWGVAAFSPRAVYASTVPKSWILPESLVIRPGRNIAGHQRRSAVVLAGGQANRSGEETFSSSLPGGEQLDVQVGEFVDSDQPEAAQLDRQADPNLVGPDDVEGQPQ